MIVYGLKLLKIYFNVIKLFITKLNVYALYCFTKIWSLCEIICLAPIILVLKNNSFYRKDLHLDFFCLTLWQNEYIRKFLLMMNNKENLFYEVFYYQSIK